MMIKSFHPTSTTPLAYFASKVFTSTISLSLLSLVLMMVCLPTSVESFSFHTRRTATNKSRNRYSRSIAVSQKEPLFIQSSFEILLSGDGTTMRPRRSELSFSSLRSSSHHSQEPEQSEQTSSLLVPHEDAPPAPLPLPKIMPKEIETISIQSQLLQSSTLPVRRKDFLRRIIIGSTATIMTTQLQFPIMPGSQTTSLTTNAAHAIEFVPASPSFSYTYTDAMDIFHAQRRACDNIITVISNGDLNEAGFKLMQVTAQTRMGGKIILEELQSGNNGNWNENRNRIGNGKINKRGENANSSTNTNTKSTSTKEDTSAGFSADRNANSVDIIKYLTVQKKFAILMDTCDECNLQVNNALRGKLGSSAVAQIKLLKVVEGAIYAFDDLLLDLEFDNVNVDMDVNVEI